MKTLLFFFLLGLTALNASGASVRAFQDFRDCTAGTNLNIGQAKRSAFGEGRWTGSSYASTNQWLTHWKVVTNAPVRFRQAVTLGTNTFTSTGTNWLHVARGNRSNEVFSFFTGVYGGNATDKVMTVRFVIRMANTNAAGRHVNFDHVELEGNPFCVCQNHTPQNNVFAHAPGRNGGYIQYEIGKAYEAELTEDMVHSICTLKFFDPETGLQVGDTSTALTGKPSWVWWVKFNSDYLDLGGVTGYTEIGGISVTWGDGTLRGAAAE
jgi:hypothetical protein